MKTTSTADGARDDVRPDTSPPRTHMTRSESMSTYGVRDLLARYQSVPVSQRKYNDFLPVARFELSRHGFPQQASNLLADAYAHTLHCFVEQRGMASLTQHEKDRLLQEVLSWEKQGNGTLDEYVNASRGGGTPHVQ